LPRESRGIRQADPVRGGYGGASRLGPVFESRRLSAFHRVVEALLRGRELLGSGTPPLAQSSRPGVSVRRSPRLRPGFSKWLPRGARGGGRRGPPGPDRPGDRAARRRRPRRRFAKELASDPRLGSRSRRVQALRDSRRGRGASRAHRVLRGRGIAGRLGPFQPIATRSEPGRVESPAYRRPVRLVYYESGAFSVFSTLFLRSIRRETTSATTMTVKSASSSIALWNAPELPFSKSVANCAVRTRIRRVTAMSPTMRKGSGTSVCSRKETCTV